MHHITYLAKVRSENFIRRATSNIREIFRLLDYKTERGNLEKKATIIYVEREIRR